MAKFTFPGRVWLEIDPEVLVDNFRRVGEAVTPCAVMAVLKANAYGLGVVPIAEALVAAGAERLGVAEPNEALQLVVLGKPVQILSSLLPEEVEPMVAAGVVVPITDEAMATTVSAAAVRLGRVATVHIKLDTGMGRLGILIDGAQAVIERISRLPGLHLEGIFSHFPFAYERGSDLTNRQMDLFCALLGELAEREITFAKRHIANSDAINNFPRACREPFNLVRTGINLHGSFDIIGTRRLHVKPVLTLKTRLSAVRRLPAGSTIGYGQTYRLARAKLTGTISAGYADGLPLALSNRGYVLIRGVPCDVLGRVSMDYTVVSLEEVPEAAVGDEVVCLGGEGAHALRVEDWAALKNTHPYEVICSFGSRVERRMLRVGAER